MVIVFTKREKQKQTASDILTAKKLHKTPGRDKYAKIDRSRSPAAWAASPDMLRRAEATAAAAGRLTAVLTSAET